MFVKSYRIQFKSHYIYIILMNLNWKVLVISDIMRTIIDGIMSMSVGLCRSDFNLENVIGDLL